MARELRLLLIEDNEDDALLVVRELAKGGYTPDFVRVDTVEALDAALESASWDAVIADFSLPAFTGLDALRAIQAKGLDLPFILVSGAIGEERAVEAMRAGGHDFIVKGNYARLMPALERELQEAENRRERRRAVEELRRAHDELEQRVRERTAELEEANEALRKAHSELEQRVGERTEDLARTVSVLREEIAEREKAEAALRESEQKYRALFEESKDVICIMGPDNRLVDINPAGSELFGYGREELLSIDFASQVYCDQADLDRFLRELSEKGYVRDFEACMRRKDAERIHVLTAATVVRDKQGEIAGYRSIIHDLTKRKQLEQQLLQSQKMESVGLLAGGVAHDFNNLLTAISGYSQLIQDQFSPRDELLATCIGQVMAATDRAVELTRSLLAFSRKQIINPQPVQINDIVINLSKLLTRIIGEDIEYTTTLAGNDLTVLADRGQIDQVLINLATNARDAMPQGGRLHIRTEQIVLDMETAERYGLSTCGDHALISVTDTGVGMARETLEKIFEPFFTTKEVGKGTGLGLSIIYGIIRQHNGSITALSEPGKGTTFAIYLPLLEAAAGEPAVQAPSAPAGGTETLLLAEDDAMVRKFMQKILEMAGYTVITAVNGKEAVELFLENRDRIALVICDVVMPKKNGREVYDEIRAQSPDARFLFTSGYNDEIIHTKGILHDNIELMTKPVNRLQLLAKLREILDS